MEKLIEEYNAVEKELDSCLMSGLYAAFLFDVYNENLSQEEQKQRSESNRQTRIVMQIELLYLLVGLCDFDNGEYHEKMLDALKIAVESMEYDSYYYETESERTEFKASMLKIFLGDEWQSVYKYLPENYKNVSFKCDGYILGKVIRAAEIFDSKEFTDKSARIIGNFLSLTEKCCSDSERDMYGIIDILLREYLIDAMPDIAADLYTTYAKGITEYLDPNTGDKLFALANNLAEKDIEKAMAIFRGVLDNRRMYCAETSIYCWAVKAKISVCEINLMRNLQSCDKLEELIKLGLDNKITDIDNQQELLYTDLAVYSALILHMSIELLSVSRYKDIVFYYYDFCTSREYINDWVNTHKAYEYIAAYYMETGEYLQAEQYYRKMLNCCFSEEDRVEGGLIAHIKLFIIYSIMNNDKRFALCEEVFDDIYNNFNSMVMVTERVETNIKMFLALYINCFIYSVDFNEQLDKVVDMVNKYHLMSDDVNNMADAVLHIGMLQILFRIHENLGDIDKYYDDMIGILKPVEEFNIQHFNSYLDRDIINWYGILSGIKNTDTALKYFEQSYEKYSSSNKYIDILYKSSTAKGIAVLYIKNNDYINAKKYLNEWIKINTERLSLALRYLDEEKLLQMIEETTEAYENTYNYLSKMSNEILYDYVLKYKELKSYIIQIRNELLKIYPDNKGLLNRIHELRDQIAKYNTNNIFFESVVPTDALEKRLEELEAQFETEFPIVDITPQADVNDLLLRIKSNQAIIEYVRRNKITDHADLINKHFNDEERLGEIIIDSYEYEAYVVRNIDNRLVINKECIGSIESIGDKIYEFLSCMLYDQRDDMYEGERETTIAKVDLYKAIFEPLIKHLEGVDELIIAPTDDISAVSFDILGKNKKECLIDIYNIRYIECGRDLLKTHGATAESGALLIGNPLYDYKKKLNIGEHWRGAHKMLEPLPFSGIEVDRISKRLGCKPYTDRYATKQLILDASGYRYIHISTHGDFDYEYEKNPIYASCMYFAGAQNWLNTKKEDKYYGNGILTADEISRLDLHETELVVLSSCYSGAVDIDVAKGASGLRSSFKSAGAKYIVMSQWELSDLGAAIMMDKFYEYLESMPVADALKNAKLYLRNVTVGELRLNGWLEYSLKDNKAVKSQIDKLKECNAAMKPFSDLKYWGSMICLEC